MNKVYLVYPPKGYGANDMVIVAESAIEAEKMFYAESGMEGEYYEEARKQGCEVQRVLPQLGKRVVYERQDNL